MQWDFPPEKKIRVIVNTDAKNEADDQYAIVHAILTPAFELHGIVQAHFGTTKSPHTLKDSHDETMLLLRLMGLEARCGWRTAPKGRSPMNTHRSIRPAPGLSLHRL